MDYEEALIIAQEVAEKFSPFCSRLEIAGSLRRQEALVNDIDLILIPKDIFGVRRTLSLFPRIIMSGVWKSRIDTGKGIECDINACGDARSWGAFRLHHTGPLELNIKMRSAAKKMGLKLSQYGLTTADSEEEFVAGHTEEEIFEALGMDYIPAEMR